jgi:hypothetical protein
VEDQRADGAVETARAGVRALAERAPEEARRAAQDEVRRWWPRIIISVAVVVALIVIGGGYAIVDLYVRSGATSAALSTLQQAQQAKTSGDKANSELAQRGQPQVPIPTPGTAPDTDVIVASAAARVLASLPDRTPSAAALGQAVARYVAANPVAPAQPTPGQISSAVAGYFAANPPPSGPPGPSGGPGQNGANGADGQPGANGAPGRPPTAEEIEAAVGAYFRDHPEALCPNGGSIAQLRVQLADGGSADTWTCVVATYPAPTTTPALPIPTT